MVSKAVIFSILLAAVFCVIAMSVDVLGQKSSTTNLPNTKSIKKVNLPTTSVTTERLVTTIRNSSSVSVGYYGLGQISCKSDETLTGGGYYSPQFREMLSVYRNGPSQSGKTWMVEMMYVGNHFYGQAPQFTIYAMCTKIVS